MNRIRVGAEALLEDLGLGVPVDVEAALRARGLEIRYLPLSRYLLGCLVLGPSGWVACVNSRHAATRERLRWTLAHELGHWCLHRHRKPALMCYRTGNGVWEREANQFAAEFLMPYREVVRLLSEGRAFTSMALYFGVSLQAMDWRLREVGWHETRPQAESRRKHIVETVLGARA